METKESFGKLLKGFDEDVAMKIFNQGYSNGVQHRSSSPETLEAINNLKKAVDMEHEKTNDKIDGIKDGITEMKVMIAKMPEEIFKVADNKYSPLWAADAVKWLIGSVMGIMVTAIIYSLLKK